MPATITRVRTYRIQRPDQIEALASPVRQEIVDALQLSGPSAIVQLAAHLERAPDSLYYHVRQLEQVGLVVRQGSRRSGRRDEALYDVPGHRMHVDTEPRTAREVTGILDLVGSALRIAQRDLRAAFAAGIARYQGRRRNTWGGRFKGWLTRAELDELKGHLAAIHELLVRGERDRGGDLHAFTWVVTPVPPSKRSRTKRTKT
jgi:DNA-binding transcriptional ArsR family regulator